MRLNPAAVLGVVPVSADRDQAPAVTPAWTSRLAERREHQGQACDRASASMWPLAQERVGGLAGLAAIVLAPDLPWLETSIRRSLNGRDGYLELAGEGPIGLHLKTGRLQLKGMLALVWLERVGITATVNSVFRYYRP